MPEINRDHWSTLWLNAKHNCGDRPSLLCNLLGYSLHSPTGWRTANTRWYTNMRRGSVPRLPAQQRLLQMLGGPHGQTIVIALCIQRGLKPPK